MPAGRPESYTPELINEIFNQLDAGKSLIVIFKEHEEYPAITTFYDHLNRHPDLDNRYREIRANSIARWVERIEQEAQDVKTIHEFETAQGTKAITNSAAVQKVDLQMRVARWIGSTIKPRRYGNDIPQAINVEGDTPELRLESVFKLVNAGAIGPDEGMKLTAIIKSQIELKDYASMSAKMDEMIMEMRAKESLQPSAIPATEDLNDEE